MSWYSPAHVPFEVVNLPVARGPEEIRAGLARLAMTPLPAIVMHDTGPTLGSAVDYLKPLLPDSMVFSDDYDPRDTERVPEFGSGVGGRDIPFHVDNLPVTKDQQEIQVKFHHNDRTNNGDPEEEVVEANFFRYDPTYLQQPGIDNTWYGDSERMDKLIRKGRVDIRRLLPVCYRGIGYTGTTFAFKQGEPLLHGFRSLVSDRHSRTIGANLTTHPGLNLVRAG